MCLAVRAHERVTSTRCVCCENSKRVPIGINAASPTSHEQRFCIFALRTKFISTTSFSGPCGSFRIYYLSTGGYVRRADVLPLRRARRRERISWQRPPATCFAPPRPYLHDACRSGVGFVRGRR